MIGTIIWGIIAGAIVGFLARLILPGRQNISILWTVVAGILGATLGGIIADWLGVGETKGIDWIRHLIQIALGVLFVWIAAKITSGRQAGSSGRRIAA